MELWRLRVVYTHTHTHTHTHCAKKLTLRYNIQGIKNNTQYNSSLQFSALCVSILTLPRFLWRTGWGSTRRVMEGYQKSPTFHKKLNCRLLSSICDLVMHSQKLPTIIRTNLKGSAPRKFKTKSGKIHDYISDHSVTGSARLDYISYCSGLWAKIMSQDT